MKSHVVCFPLPFQSHIIAMLKLAKLLYCKGFHVTFVNTEFNHQKVLKSRGLDSLKGLPDFRFETIPDGLPPCDIDAAQDIMALCEAIQNNFPGPVRSLISKLNDASAMAEVPRVTCIVTDACMKCPLEAAEEFGVPGVSLWTMSAAFLMSALHCRLFVEKGIIPPKDDDYLTNGYLDTPVDLLPGMRNIRLKDLPDYFFSKDPLDHIVSTQLQGLSKASGVIIHSFEALESEVLEAMKSLPHLPPIYTIGPLQLLLKEIPNNLLNSIGSNFWKEDEDSLKWLDSRQPNSVIYVNFGSLIVLTSEQLIEFAWGLANSKYPFLWVIRPNLVIGEDAVIPQEFTKETADRGKITGWCPQEQVLCHSSIGGFLTHSGWNSTMDTFCAGVPVISWPFFADQPSNCRYTCVHWDIGIELDKNVKRDEVECLVRELMEGEKGKEIRKKAMTWKEIAEESTKPSGTSYKNLDRVAEILVQKTLD